MGIIKNYHDKKWTLQFLDALYNSIDIGCKYGMTADNTDREALLTPAAAAASEPLGLTPYTQLSN
jgi:hypothetical protein